MPGLRQFFRPLPKRPQRALLDEASPRQEAETIQLDSGEQLLDGQAFERARLEDVREVQRARAVDLMARANENRYVADYKLMSVRSAHRWYGLSLLLFILLGVAFTAYVLSGDVPASSTP